MHNLRQIRISSPLRVRVLFIYVLVFAFSFSLYTYTRSHMPGTGKNDNTAYAATSNTLNFQGRLMSASGNLVPDGFYNIQFNLYHQSSGGSTLWTETHDYNSNSPDRRVRIVNGYFSAYLGNYDSLADESDVNWQDDVWLGMTVRGSGTCSFAGCTPADSEMTPRFKLSAVPYALQAGNVRSSNTNSASTNSDSITIQSGNAAGATSNSGSITLDVGTATGTTGTISIGTTNASSVTIGRTTGTSSTTLNSGSGNIILQSQGTSTIGVIQIGAGGVGSTTPDFLALDVKSTTGDPAGGAEGYIYYNTFDNKFRCYQDSAWTDCIGAGGGGGGTLQQSYDVDADGSDAIIALTSADDSIIFRNPSSGGTDSSYILTLDQLSTGATGGLSIQSAGSGNLLLITDTTATARDVLTIANGGDTTFRSQTDSATAFQILQADGSARFSVDTSANQGIKIYSDAGTEIVEISDTTGLQVRTTGTSAWTNLGTSGDGTPILNLYNSGGTTVASFSGTGAALFQNSVNSSTAFQIQNQAGTSNLFIADTTNNRIGIGTASPDSKLDIEATGDGTSLLRFSTERAWEFLQSGTGASTSLELRDINGDKDFKITSTTSADVNSLFRASATEADNRVFLAPNGGRVGIGNGTTSGGQTALLHLQSTEASLDLLKITDGTATARDVLTIADGGATTFRSQTDSPSAFQVQNTAGASLFNIDSTNAGNISLLANNGAQTGTWTTNTNNLPAGLNQTNVAYANGYVYVVGGDTGSLTAQVLSARVNANGSIGAFTNLASTPLPVAREDISVVALNGYLYAIGGNSTDDTATTGVTTANYAKINGDGTIGQWETTTALPSGRSTSGTVAYNGHIYLVAGSDTSGAIGTTVYAKQNPDGTLGSWTISGNSFSGGSGTNIRRAIRAVVANGYLYALGGQEGATSHTDIYYSRINADGSIGSWSVEADKLPSGRTWGASAVANGYLYYYGGYDGASSQDEVFYAQLNSDGSTGAWATNTVNMTVVESDFGFFSVNGYLYGIGLGASDNEVHYVSTPRVSVAGSIDLVGLSGENLSEGGTGGSITAGNGIFVGSLSVQDQVNLYDSLYVEGNINTTGYFNLQNNVNSTTAFQIQNASGSSLVTADTTNLDVAVDGRLNVTKSITTTTEWNRVSQSTAGTLASGGTSAMDRIYSSVVFNGSLYVGTNKSGAAEVYRYDGGSTWTRVSFGAGQVDNGDTSAINEIRSMVVYDGALYVGTSKTDAAEVYRYESGTNWTKVTQATAGTIASGGTALINNASRMVVYDGKLILGTGENNGTEIYRYEGGSTWTRISSATPGTISTGQNASVDGVSNMVVLDNALYVGTIDGTVGPSNGGEIYRYEGGSTWTPITDTTPGEIGTNTSITSYYGMAVYNGALYAGTTKDNAAEVYRYNGGLSWTLISHTTPGTIVSGGTSSIDGINELSVYNGDLYVGTNADGGQGEIYRYNSTTGVFTKVSQATAGTISSGGTSAIDNIYTLESYNGALYAGTGETGLAEAYKFMDSIISVGSSADNSLFSVSNSGNATFQSNANSSNAFNVQNTVGFSLFNIDSTNAGVISFGNNGQLSSWRENVENLPFNRQLQGSSIANGYVYITGGRNGTAINTAQASVIYGKINSDGTIGVLTSTTPSGMPAVSAHTTVTANGYIYVLGGKDTGNVIVDDTYVAKLNADGTTGSFVATTPLPSARYSHNSVISNGYVYVIGGRDAGETSTNTVYYAKLNADGTLGQWGTTTTTTVSLYMSGVAVANGYIYITGGRNSSAFDEIYYSRVNSDGTIGAWTQDTSSNLPQNLHQHSLVAVGGYLYTAGGNNDTSTQTVTYSARLNSDGSVGVWSQLTSSPLPLARENYGELLEANGYIYVFGGYNGTSATNDVYYASANRVSIAGSLDLVGNSGGNFVDGSSGGSLTAGNTNVLGDFTVRGVSSMQGALLATGTSVFRNQSDSTVGFSIQNAGGTNLFSVDTQNLDITAGGRVSVVKPTAINQEWTKVSGEAGTVGGNNSAINGMQTSAVYNGALYIGVEKTDSAEIYRYDGGSTWTKVSGTAGTIGGNPTTGIDGVREMVVHNGLLYAGTDKANEAEIYRYDGGSTWTKVSGTAGTIGGGATTLIDRANTLISYNGALYVGTQEADLAEIYRYDGGSTWTKVSGTAGTIGGNPTTLINSVKSFAVHDGFLFAGTEEGNSAEIYRYDGGSTWTKVSGTAGTIGGNPTGTITAVAELTSYNGSLYAGTNKTDQAEVYRYDGGTTWTRVSSGTAGTIATSGTTGADSANEMTVYNGSLYLGTYTTNSQGEAYRYNNAVGDWTKVSQSTAGTFANGGTAGIDEVQTIITFGGSIYFGTFESTFAEVYRYNDNTLEVRNTDSSMTFSVGPTGSTLFQNSTNSANAFQVQNAAGSSIFNIDTTAGGAINISNTGEINKWITNTITSPATLDDHAITHFGGYVYMAGGYNGATTVNELYYAKVNADGSIGSWITQTDRLPISVEDHYIEAVNGYIYLIGGEIGGTEQNATYYAKINNDGSVGTFRASANLPVVNDEADTVVLNGYIYVLGGASNVDEVATVYYAKPNPDGTISAWNSTTSLPQARAGHGATTANGYIYVTGGINTASATQTTIYYAKPASDGTISAWTEEPTNPLPSTRLTHSVVTVNGYMYAIGGSITNAGVVQSTVYYAPLNSLTGSVGAWSTSANALPSPRSFLSRANFALNGHIYIISGSTTGGTVVNTIYRTSTSRVTISGSLDLVGSSGGNFADGASGGSLTAGNTNVLGTFNVQEQANFWDNVYADQNLTVAGNMQVQGQLMPSAIGNLTSAEGMTDLPDAIAVQGNYAYVVTYGDSLFHTIDITNPTNPELIASIALTTGAVPEHVAVAGRYAYVGNSGNDTLETIDIGDPFAPVSVSSKNAGSNPIWISIGGRYLYMLSDGSDTLKIFDLENPENPVEVSSISMGTNPYKAYLQGKILYVVTTASNIITVDISNPLAPFTRDSLLLSFNPTAIALSGRYAYVSNSGNDTIQIVDVADPSDITLLTSISATTNIQEMVVQGDNLYTIDQTDDVLVTYNISNPTTPVRTASATTGGESYHIVVKGRYAYTTASDIDTFEVFDLGGAYIQQLQTGGIDSTSITAQELNINNNVIVGGAINVGGSVSINGSLNVGGYIGESVFNGDVLASTIAVSTTSSRVQNTVTDTANAGQYNSIAIGIDGLPVISYFDDTNDDLAVYKCTNPSCTTGVTTKISDPASDGWGQWTSIAIGSDGFPVISHYNLTDTDLAITKCADLACAYNTTTKFADALYGGSQIRGVYNAIAIGSDGLPVVFYNQDDGVSDRDPLIAQCTTIYCTALSNYTAVNDGAESWGGFADMTIGSDGFPVVGMRNATDQALAVLRCTVLDCSTTSTQANVYDTAQNVALDIGIAVGSDGFPVISHHDNADTDLVVTKCNSIDCSISTTVEISDTDSTGFWTSIAIGTDGLPIISAENVTDSDLYIVKCTNMSCTSNTITNLGTIDTDFYTSIAIGNDGMPVISHWDNVANNNLGITKCVDIACSSTSASIKVGGINIGSKSVAFQNAYINNIQSSGVNPLKFSSNGVERVVIDATGLATFNGDVKISKATDDTASLTKVSQATAGTIEDGGGARASIDGVRSSAVFNGSLYVATDEVGATEVFRYDGGTNWTQVNSADGSLCTGGDADIDNITVMIVYNGYLYAGTDETDQAEFCRYDGGTTWTRVTNAVGQIASGGLATIDEISSAAVVNGVLYIGTEETNLAEVYRYDGGTTWTQVSNTADDGNICGDIDADEVSTMISFDNQLYVGTSETDDAEVCRYNGNAGAATAFTRISTATTGQIATGVTGFATNDGIKSMAVYNGKLFVGTFDSTGVTELFRYDGNASSVADSGLFTQINALDGTVCGQTGVNSINNLTVYNGQLYIGTSESGLSEICRYDGGTTIFRVSTITPGTYVTGGTAGINGTTAMTVFGGKLYIGTEEPNFAEIYVYSAIEGQSFSLKFGAASDNSNAEQGTYYNEGGISFLAEQQANNSLGNLGTGSFLFTHGITTAFGAYDIAEDYPTRDEDILPGSLVSIDPNETGFVKRTSQKDDRSILGVYSEKPGLRLSQADNTISGARAIPVALAGRVSVNVTGENGPIVPGDYLTSSSTPGYATKAIGPGPTLGKALEGFSGSGTGKVMTFINISYYVPQVEHQGANYTAITNLSVSGISNVSTLNATTLTVSGVAQFAGGLKVAGHIVSDGELPETEVLGASGLAINGATINIQGNDIAGIITITTANGLPLSEGELAKIIFANQYGKVPTVNITPIGADSARLKTYIDQTEEYFIIGTIDPPQNNRLYKYNYQVIE